MGFKTGILAYWLRLWPKGWDLDLMAGIWAWRLGFRYTGWDMGLMAGIWALRLRCEPEVGRGGWTDRQMYVMDHPCVLQDVGPLGPLPKKEGKGERERKMEKKEKDMSTVK